MKIEDTKMNITAAQYTVDANGDKTGIQATIEGEDMLVPINPKNRYYDELIHQEDIGMITIQAAG
jgi:hypothetical protein